MKTRPLLHIQALRMKRLPHAPWLAQPNDAPLLERLEQSEPHYTPLLTTGVSEGQITAWAPSHEPPRGVEEANFTQTTRAQLLKRAWAAARAHTPSLGALLRWCQDRPTYDLLSVVVGDAHLDLEGDSMGVSLLIGYITWLSELPPLRAVAVSVSFTSRGLEGVDLEGLRHKVQALSALPELREVVVHQSQEEEAKRLTRDVGLSVTAISSLDELVIRLWGDERTSRERAITKLTAQITTPQAFKRHLDHIERYVRSSHRGGDQPLLQHLLTLEQLPSFQEFFQALRPIQQVRTVINKLALSRHLGVALPPSAHEHESMSALGHLVMGDDQEDGLNLERLNVGLKQEWIAEYLQNLQDQTAHVSSDQWGGWGSYLEREQGAAVSLRTLTHVIEDKLSHEDDSQGRAKLLGTFARLKLSQGLLSEAHARSLQAIQAWEFIAQEDPEELRQISYPLAFAWRALRGEQITGRLQELIGVTARWLHQELNPQNGLCFVGHEVLRAALWLLTYEGALSVEEEAWQMSAVTHLTSHALTRFEEQLGLNVSFPSDPSFTFTSAPLSHTTPSLIELLCDRLHTAPQWAAYLIGASCGAIYERAEPLAKLGLLGVKERCERIWEALLQQGEFVHYLDAQRALALRCGASLKKCAWEGLQGVTLLAHVWRMEGHSAERIVAFFEDPISDNELLSDLKLRATYLS